MKARVRGDMPALNEIRDELEAVIKASGWFPNDHFQWVGLIIRYGIKTEQQPHFQTISKKHGDLPIAVEVDTHQLLDIQKDPVLLKAFLKAVTIHSLLGVARRYKLPMQGLEHELSITNAA